MSEVIAFVAVSAVVICTPGPDTALTIRNALSGGRRAGVMTAVGVALGQGIWTLTAAVGVAAVIVASQPAFLALKLVGAGYLVYLGLQSLRAAFRPRSALPGVAPRAAVTPELALRQGLISNLSNPKMVAFFTSLLPQFVPTDARPFWPLLAFGLAFCLMTLAWLSAYSFAVETARRVLSRSRVARALDALVGATLVAFGARLATAER